MVAKSVLAGLIERTLIAQDAKRALKNPKQLDRLYEAADKFWHEEELPPMMRRYLVDTEAQLKQKLDRVRPVARGAPPELPSGVPGPGLPRPEAGRPPQGRAAGDAQVL